ncbi:MAG: hypothetical protein WAW42_00340 [Candidatus Competibacteraceae bacterium]
MKKFKYLLPHAIVAVGGENLTLAGRKSRSAEFSAGFQPRGATPWRLVKLVQRELTEAIQAAGQWNLSRWSAALHAMQERPRRRTLQTVPERIRHLITDCQAWGVSNI